MVRFKLKWQQGNLFQVTKMMSDAGATRTKPLWFEAAERAPPMQTPPSRPRRFIHFPYDYLAADFAKKYPRRALEAPRIAKDQYFLMKKHGMQQHDAFNKVMEQNQRSFNGKEFISNEKTVELNNLRNAAEMLHAMQRTR